MKAIRLNEFGGPEVLKLEEVPDPSPGPGQVVVRLHAAGINPVDTYIREGRHAVKPSLPYTPGTDGAGEIEAIGEGVTRFAPGDRVYTAGAVTGTYAEKALCQVSQVYPLPECVSYEQGAGINVPYATAYRALFHRAQAIEGEDVLVHGASGGVGTAALQLARLRGLSIIGTAGTDEGCRHVLEQGADQALNHNSPDYMDEVMEHTSGRGVDVILEMLANVNLGKDLNMLARFGRVVVIGSRGTVEIDPRAAMMRDASILGMTLLNVTDKERASIHEALANGLANQRLSPVVGRKFPLDDAARAHKAVLEPGAYGKIVLTMN